LSVQPSALEAEAAAEVEEEEGVVVEEVVSVPGVEVEEEVVVEVVASV